MLERLGRERGQPIQRMSLAPAFIQPEGAFVRVEMQMLRGNMVPSALNAALEQRSHGLGPVRVNAARSDIFAPARIDRAMLVLTRARVGFVLIGIDRGTEFHMAADQSVEGGANKDVIS